jgi:hypothetical protein
MKFQVNIEIDERQAKMNQREVVDLVLDSLGSALRKTDAYFDCGVNLEQVVSGMTN